MNTKKFVLAGLAAFLVIFFFEWVFHGMHMKANYYDAMPGTFRPEAEMQSHMLWLFLGQLVLGLGSTYIFIKGRQGTGIVEGVRFGLAIGMTFGVGGEMIRHAVMPYTLGGSLTLMVGHVVEMCIVGIVIAAIYKD